MIKFKEVSKKFGQISALEKISFEIEPGEFVFLTGPSGAGKTTIIKLLLREYLPSEGVISVDGQNLAKLSSKELTLYRRKVGVVFQDFKLIGDRTVFENVALPLEMIGREKEEIKGKVSKILELVSLEDRASFFPAQLAGGELQRVCLARAISYQPKILLADEPTGNLDPTTSWQIMKLFKKVNRMGTTVLIATHNVEIVDSLKERVLKIEKGALAKDQKGGKYELK